MLVATFGPTTAWVGNSITWDGVRFVLEGYGPVPAAALVDYDLQGHLQWASAELRSWAQSYAQWEAGAAATQAAASAQTAVQPYAAAQPYAAMLPQTPAQPWAVGPAAAGPPAAKKPFPAWAIVLIVFAVLLPMAGIFAAVLIPAVLFDSQHARADESAVKEGVRSFQIVVQSWAVDHQDVYPSTFEMNPTAMSDYMDMWPANPYTGRPMTQGTGPGDFSYEVSPDGTSFRLIGYGEDGKIVIDIGSDTGIMI
jgi:hypothetical protein